MARSSAASRPAPRADFRSRDVTDVSRGLDSLLGNPTVILTESMMEGLALRIATGKEDMQILLRRISRQAETGGLADPNFQAAMKKMLRIHAAELMQDQAVAPIRIANLKAFLWPEAGLQSMQSRLEGELYLVEPLTYEGRAVGVWGLPDSGKTDFSLWMFEKHHGIFQSIQNEGNASRFWRFAERYRARRRRKGGDRVFRPQDVADELSVGANNLPESVHAKLRREFPYEFGLVGSRGVRLITNVAIKSTSPLYSDTDYAPVMGDLMTAQLQADLRGYYHQCVFDEAAAFASNVRSSSRENVAWAKNFANRRKANGSLVMVSQREERLEDDIRDQLVRNYYKLSETHLLMVSKGGRSEEWGDVPPTIIQYEKKDRATFVLDADPENIWNIVAQRRRESGREWTHKQEVELALRLVALTRDKKDQLKDQESTETYALVVAKLMQMDPQKPGRNYKAKAIGADVGDELGFTVSEERVHQIAKQLRERDEEMSRRESEGRREYDVGDDPENLWSNLASL